MASAALFVFFAACLAPLSEAAGSQTSGKMVRSRSKAAGTHILNPAELKQKLSQVLQSEDVQEMMKDPKLKDGLSDLLHNPEAVGKLTHDPELASSLQTMLDKDPNFLDDLIPSGDSTRISALTDIEGATVEQIHAEFSRMEKADQMHATELRDSMSVRKNLKHELESLALSVAEDDKLIDRHANPASLMSVSAEGKPLVEPLDDELEDVKEDSDPASRLDIGNSLVEYGTKIKELLKQLHGKDEREMKAMMNNAKARRSLKMQLQRRIKEQQAELELAMKEEQGAFAPLRGVDE